MRYRLTPTLLVGACALAFGPALAAETGVGLSTDQGVVRVDAAKTGPLELSAAQRQAVLDAVLQRDTFQPTPKEFDATEGAAVTSKLDIHALPAPLINEIPILKEYMYAHIDRNVVIVDAKAKKIAALIPLPAQMIRSDQADDKKVKQAAENAVGGLAELSDDQRRAIYQAATGDAQPVPQGEALRARIQVPAAIHSQPLPSEVAAQTPGLTGLGYAKLQDGRVLVIDPQKHEIAGIITRDEGTKVAKDDASNSAANAGSNNIGSGGNSRDPLREREETGKPSAYTGPSTTGK